METYFKTREAAVRAHPTKINWEKVKKLTNKNHIPGQLYLNKGLPCEYKPKPKAKV